MSGPPRAPRGALLTLLAGLLLGAFVVVTTWLSHGSSRIEGVPDPEQALALVVGRTLELDEALERAAAWERGLWRPIAGDRQEDLAEGIGWYEELLERSSDPRVELQSAILQAEDGRAEAVRRTVAEWRGRPAPLPAWADIVGSAYLGEPPVPARALEALRDDDWFTDRLALRWAERTRDPGRALEAATALATRGDRLLARLRWHIGAQAVLFVVGLAGLVLCARGLRRLGDAIVPPPWRTRDGLTVLTRGGAVAVLAIVAGSLGAPSSLDESWRQAWLGVTTSLALVLMVLLARRRLLAPAGLGLPTALGLVIPPGRVGRLALVVLALVAAGQLGDVAADFSTRALGLVAHWTEGLDPVLASGPPPVLGVVLLDTVVATPLLEEIVFRGLLFATLRRRLSLGVAAPLSAVIFASAHGYGAAGLLAVFWSGVVWAVAYEKTGSLLPGVIAHAVGNLNASLWVLLLFRT